MRALITLLSGSQFSQSQESRDGVRLFVLILRQDVLAPDRLGQNWESVRARGCFATSDAEPVAFGRVACVGYYALS